VYRANDNRKRCALLSEVTQTNLRNIENFKTKPTGKKQMMFCIACVKTKWSLSMMSKQWCREHKSFYAIMFSFWKFESRFFSSEINDNLSIMIYLLISLDYLQLIKFNY